MFKMRREKRKEKGEKNQDKIKLQRTDENQRGEKPNLTNDIMRASARLVSKTATG